MSDAPDQYPLRCIRGIKNTKEEIWKKDGRKDAPNTEAFLPEKDFSLEERVAGGRTRDFEVSINWEDSPEAIAELRRRSGVSAGGAVFLSTEYLHQVRVHVENVLGYKLGFERDRVRCHHGNPFHGNILYDGLAQDELWRVAHVMSSGRLKVIGPQDLDAQVRERGRWLRAHVDDLREMVRTRAFYLDEECKRGGCECEQFTPADHWMAARREYGLRDTEYVEL